MKFVKAVRRFFVNFRKLRFSNLKPKTRNQKTRNQKTHCIPQSKQQPKKHPPLATPLDFPSYTPKRRSLGFLADDVDIFSLFSLPRKLDDLNEKHVSILNLDIDRDVLLCMLIPQCYLPPTTWESDPARSGGSDVFPNALVDPATLSNGLAVPGHDVFFARMKELIIDNDDAFRFINREPPRPGRAETKVAQFRKFFEALYAMSEYWDTSLDNDTIPRPEQTTPPEDVMVTDQPHSEAQALNIDNDKEPYTGRRINTGRDMPKQYREDAVKSLVETIAWCFRCQVSSPRNHAKLKLKNMFLPVLQTAMVYRPPQDRQRAKQGFVEGPLMAIQCRAETVFSQAGEKKGEGQAEIVDLLREVGAMLLLAQERARDGKTEVTPGPDQWWVTAPRWGGTLGGEVRSTEATNSNDAPPPAQKEDEEVLRDDETVRLEDKKRRKMEKTRQRRSKRASSGYHTLQAPASTWDKKTTYAQIGKKEGSEYDDIYLVSSINHHLSILRLRIHARFVEYLTTGKAAETASEQPWYGLDVKRSKWFDLLVPADRVQAMRGIWGVMAWLMRGEGADREF